jgi:hypothetical protein
MQRFAIGGIRERNERNVLPAHLIGECCRAAQSFN